jgi:hypothetical protein
VPTPIQYSRPDVMRPSRTVQKDAARNHAESLVGYFDLGDDAVAVADHAEDVDRPAFGILRVDGDDGAPSDEALAGRRPLDHDVRVEQLGHPLPVARSDRIPEAADDVYMAHFHPSGEEPDHRPLTEREPQMTQQLVLEQPSRRARSEREGERDQ